MSKHRRFLWFLLGCILISIAPAPSAIAQITIRDAKRLPVFQLSGATSDPQALALALRALAALWGNQVIHDVTLTGNVTWVSGNSETGTAALEALGTNESRIDLALPDGTRTEIRDASAGFAQGKWINPDGKSGMFAAHNAMTDAVWFFPALGSLTGGPNIVLSYVGPETRNGQSVQHLRSCHYQTPSPNTPDLTEQQLSTMDFYLDAASSLPVAVVFNQHPDDNARVNIPIEVDYSNYQPISGVLVPMHIQKSMNGAPLLDVTLTGVVFNSGLALSEFSVN